MEEDSEGIDLLLNMIEKEEDNDSSSDTSLTLQQPTMKRQRGETIEEDAGYERKRQKINESDSCELDSMKAKMKAMEDELARLKSQLKSDTTSTNRSTEVGGTAPPTQFKKGKRVAHQSTHNSASSRKVASASVEEDKDCVTDRFSGIRIRNPLVSTTLMTERMKGRRIIRIPQIEGAVKGGDVEGDWVAIGVIVSKSHPKDTCKGKKFSIWRLSDLSSQTANISFFLFDKVFQEHWKTPLGHVVAILNAGILTNRETNYSTGISCNANKYSLTLDNPAKLMDMGVSADFTMCKAIAKSGKLCQNYANKQHNGFCDYHVQKEYSKVRSNRMNCQGGYGPNTQTLQKKLLGNQQVMYGGRSYCGEGGATTGSKKREKQNQRLFVPGARQEAEELLGSITADTSTTTTTAAAAARRSSGDNILKELMKGQGPGALCLGKHFDKEKQSKPSEILKKERSALDLLQEHSQKIKIEPKTVPQTSSTHDKMNRTEADEHGNGTVLTKRRHSTEKQTVKKLLKPSLSSPEEFELFRPDNLVKTEGVVSTDTPTKTTVSADTPTMTTVVERKPVLAPSTIPKKVPSLGRSGSKSSSDRGKDRAIALVKRKGNIKKANPNGIIKNKVLSTQQQNEIKLRVGGAVAMETTSESDEGAKTIEKENIVGAGDFEKILNAKSSHDWIIAQDDNDRQEAYFNSLEKKEKLEERLSQIKELNVRVVQCTQCNYIAESVGSKCQRENHRVTRLRAMKRCFKCCGCGQRVYVYNERYPTSSCQCGENKFQKCSLYKQKTGPKLPSEVLLLRGHEQKFLNSLN